MLISLHRNGRTPAFSRLTGTHALFGRSVLCQDLHAHIILCTETSSYCVTLHLAVCVYVRECGPITISLNRAAHHALYLSHDQGLRESSKPAYMPHKSFSYATRLAPATSIANGGGAIQCSFRHTSPPPSLTRAQRQACWP